MGSSSTSLFILSRSRLNQAPEFTSAQAQVDGALSHALSETGNLSIVASLLMGTGASRLARTGILALGANATGRAALIVQGLSHVGSLSAEVVAFEGTARALDRFPNPNRWNWHGEGGLAQGFFTSGITFTALRGAGHAARSQNIVFQHAAQSTAMVAGHNIAGVLELIPRPTGSLMQQAFEAEITNVQLAATMGAFHAVAPGAQSVLRSLDLANQSRVGAKHSAPPSAGQNALPLRTPWDLLVPETVNGPAVPFEGGREKREPTSPLDRSKNTVFMIGFGGGGTGPARLPEDAFTPLSENGSVSPEASRRVKGFEAEREIAEYVYEALPEDLQRRVAPLFTKVQWEYEKVEGSPLRIMAFALAETLEKLNSELSPRLLMERPEEWFLLERQRNCVRDLLNGSPQGGQHRVLGVHYEKALSRISLPWLNETIVELLLEPLAEETLNQLQKSENFEYTDPRLSRSLRVLGERLGSATRDAYGNLLKFGVVTGLVDVNLDGVNPRLLHGVQRMRRRLERQNILEIDLSDLHRYFGLIELIQQTRETWGNHHPLVEGFDHSFNGLNRTPQDPLRRLQILQRIMTFLSESEREKGPFN